MSTSPVDSNVITGSSPSSEQAFEDAIDNAQTQLTDADITEQMIIGAVQVGGQMILMPRANEILNEAMSDE